MASDDQGASSNPEDVSPITQRFDRAWVGFLFGIASFFFSCLFQYFSIIRGFWFGKTMVVVLVAAAGVAILTGRRRFGLGLLVSVGFAALLAIGTCWLVLANLNKLG